MTQPRSREPYSRTVVRLPERELAEAILQLAAPLLAALGPGPSPAAVRGELEWAINLWNAKVLASPYWGRARVKPLAALRKAMCGRQAAPDLAEKFELLSRRWQAEGTLDPRLVGSWTYEPTDAGAPVLVCETTLPEGVEAHVPPPAELRIAIGGKFLDEVSIRQTATSFLSFPVMNHRGEVSADGVATVYAKMPTVVQLFAEGVLKPLRGAPVEVTIGLKKLSPLVLTEVKCTGDGGHNDVAALVFRSVGAPSGV